MANVVSATRGQILTVLLGHLTVAEMVRTLALAAGRDDVWMDDHAIDFLLWERTAFPVCGIEHTLRQVQAVLADPAGLSRPNDVPLCGTPPIDRTGVAV